MSSLTSSMENDNWAADDPTLSSLPPPFPTKKKKNLMRILTQRRGCGPGAVSLCPHRLAYVHLHPTPVRRVLITILGAALVISAVTANHQLSAAVAMWRRPAGQCRPCGWQPLSQLVTEYNKGATHSHWETTATSKIPPPTGLRFWIVTWAFSFPSYPHMQLSVISHPSPADCKHV